MPFTLKVLRAYKNTNRFYLKAGGGSKQDSKEITQLARIIWRRVSAVEMSLEGRRRKKT
jgi:hypothetical protein